MLHDALILTVFTVVIGFILGLVYEITKDPIAKAEEATAQAAYKAVSAEQADKYYKCNDIGSRNPKCNGTHQD